MFKIYIYCIVIIEILTFPLHLFQILFVIIKQSENNALHFIGIPIYRNIALQVKAEVIVN